MEQAAKYTVIGTDDNGNEIRLYAKDGSTRDSKGHLLAKHPQAIEITNETARDYIKRRKDKILEAIEKRITDVTRTSAPSEAIAAIVGKRAEIAMKDNTRTGNEAAKIVLSAVDAYQERQAPTSDITTRHEYTIDDETRELLSQLLQERRRGIAMRSDDVIAGETIENNI